MSNASAMADRWWLKERPRRCDMWESLLQSSSGQERKCSALLRTVLPRSMAQRGARTCYFQGAVFPIANSSSLPSFAFFSIRFLSFQTGASPHLPKLQWRGLQQFSFFSFLFLGCSSVCVCVRVCVFVCVCVCVVVHVVHEHEHTMTCVVLWFITWHVDIHYTHSSTVLRREV